MEWMKSTLEEAKSTLQKSKEEMAWYYNQRREPALIFKCRDRVYLDASDILTTQPSKKLAHKYLGPYSIQKAVGKNAY
jgi:hypothetical protein